MKPVHPKKQVRAKSRAKSGYGYRLRLNGVLLMCLLGGFSLSPPSTLLPKKLSSLA
ncbi:hypothetical protein SPBRAN_153 [uncultured Candidatus Thioglobus sp.]|nr:hypothetical protein SPBRAN_153 [uncultured Candidatus Thioglobus sp.]